jgi:hypothetical protein
VGALAGRERIRETALSCGCFGRNLFAFLLDFVDEIQRQLTTTTQRGHKNKHNYVVDAEGLGVSIARLSP